MLIRKNPENRTSAEIHASFGYIPEINSTPIKISKTGRIETIIKINDSGTTLNSSIRSTALEGSIIFVIPEKINTIPRIILTTLTLFTNSP